jgi:hypothetical protein
MKGASVGEIAGLREGEAPAEPEAVGARTARLGRSLALPLRVVGDFPIAVRWGPAKTAARAPGRG